MSNFRIVKRLLKFLMRLVANRYIITIIYLRMKTIHHHIIMNHLSLLFLLFLSFALNADAQEVTGTVVNGQRQAIPFTTVR